MQRCTSSALQPQFKYTGEPSKFVDSRLGTTMSSLSDQQIVSWTQTFQRQQRPCTLMP